MDKPHRNLPNFGLLIVINGMLFFVRYKATILSFFLLAFVLTSCMTGHIIFHQNAGIKDYKIFPYRTIEREGAPFQFIEGNKEEFTRRDIRVTHNKKHNPIERVLDQSGTVAFLVIRHDSILFEKYYNNYVDSSVVNSFSMAKSYTAALIGLAIEEGKIHSMEDSITTYLDELRGNGLGRIKIRHLLQMTSGIHSSEGYLNPFSTAATIYYGSNQKRVARRVHPEQRPGLTWDYKSINTALLGMIVEKVYGRNLSELLEEKIWKPLGMEWNATWSLDHKNGLEKSFCCLNAAARDFAKFGRLYLHKGNWNGTQVIPESWVELSTKIDAREGGAQWYAYHWWINGKEGDFYAGGYLGQFIYVCPAKELIIVRLGKRDGGIDWRKGLKEIAEQL